MQAIGFGNWGRFLADAQARADDPATLAAVADSQPRPAPPARPPAATVAPTPAAAKPVARPAPVDPAPPPSATPAVAAEPEHGAIWRWLHGLGLVETRHEQAVGLRRVMGSQGGLIYSRNGVALDVDHMSDDDVLALDKETRGHSPVPLLLGTVAPPVRTSWGWSDSPPYKEALKQIARRGTHKTINGRVPTREEAVRLIEESGGKIERIEEGHHPDGDSTHTEPHINYLTPGQRPVGGHKATVIVQSWK